MLAIEAQDGARLAIDREGHVELAAEAHDSGIGMKRDTEVRLLARLALEDGENTCHGMGVLPDVCAGARAAAGAAFPRVEASIGKSIAAAGGQRGNVEESAIKEPIGQRRVVPRVAPEPGCRSQLREVFCNVARDRLGRIVLRRVVPTNLAELVEIEIGIVPREDEGNLRRRARSKFHGSAQGADEGLVRGHGNVVRRRLGGVEAVAFNPQ